MFCSMKHWTVDYYFQKLLIQTSKHWQYKVDKHTICITKYKEYISVVKNNEIFDGLIWLSKIPKTGEKKTPKENPLSQSNNLFAGPWNP